MSTPTTTTQFIIGLVLLLCSTFVIGDKTEEFVYQTSSERYFGGYYHLSFSSDIPISVATSESTSSDFTIIKENITNLSMDLNIGKTSSSGDLVIFYSRNNFKLLQFSMEEEFEEFTKLGPYNIPARGVQRLFASDKISTTSYDTKLEIASNRYQQVKVAFTFFEKETPIYTSYAIYASSPKYIPIDFHTSMAVNDSIPIYIHVMCDSDTECFISNIIITHGSIIGIIFGVLIGIGLVALIVIFLKVPSLIIRRCTNRNSDNPQLLQEENLQGIQLKEEISRESSGIISDELNQTAQNTRTRQHDDESFSSHI